MYAEYNRPVDLFNLLDNKKCFLRDPDLKLIKLLREYFNNNKEKDIKWFDTFRSHIDKQYSDFIISQSVAIETVTTIPQPSDTVTQISSVTKLNITSKDYLIKVYIYDQRFGETFLMCGEQIISLSLSKETLVMTINTTFIDYEVLHSSADELEQRSLDFIKADMEDDIVYLDEDEDYMS